MRRLRRASIVGLTVIALLANSSLAMAQADDEATTAGNTDDTLFNFGYDPINHVLLWGISLLDGIYDCTLAGGSLDVTYGEPSEQGSIPADDISDASGPVVFQNRPPEEVSPDLDPAESPFVYNGADDNCGVSGGDVTGPQGQVNHGMFMKLFNSLYEGTGRGCLVRHLAQSNLGKDDQKVTTSDADPTLAPVTGGETGQVEFTTVPTACEHGKKKDNVDEDAASNGKKQSGSDSPGKSGSAPGHNK